jgi:CheY-like chemotaxis protein
MTSTTDPAPPAVEAGAAAAPHAPRVAVLNAEGPLIGLLQSWLGAEGCSVIADEVDRPGPAASVDLVIVDLPFPRQGGVDFVRHIAGRHPGVPILAMSSTFFARIECCGPVAQALGVDSVVPQPASREALVQAVQRLLKR